MRALIVSGGAADADVKLALVEGEEYLFSAEIPNDNNNLLFVRAQGDSQSIPWDNENLWTKTSDLVIPEGKDCYYLVGWTDGAWLSHGDSPAISIVGNFKGDETWGSGAHPMTIAGDKASASVTFALNAGTYEMKVWLEGFYLSLNGEGETLYQIHRDWNHADNVNMVNSGRNFELVADQAGDYTFTWTFASQNIEVSFPEKIPSPVENIQTDGNGEQRQHHGHDQSCPMAVHIGKDLCQNLFLILNLSHCRSPPVQTESSRFPGTPGRISAVPRGYPCPPAPLRPAPESGLHTVQRPPAGTR